MLKIVHSSTLPSATVCFSARLDWKGMNSLGMPGLVDAWLARGAEREHLVGDRRIARLIDPVVQFVSRMHDGIGRRTRDRARLVVGLKTARSTIDRFNPPALASSSSVIGARPRDGQRAGRQLHRQRARRRRRLRPATSSSRIASRRCPSGIAACADSTCPARRPGPGRSRDCPARARRRSGARRGRRSAGCGAYCRRGCRR